jgi:D-3-phosphoglycerate dehydrogenase
LIVNLFRKVPQAQAHVRAGGWDYKLFVGKELHGKTIGILGSGNVGQTVAKIAQGFSMNVISHTKNPSKEKAKKMFVEDFVSLRKLLRESDVVVTALPLNESTMGLISKAELNIMKKDAFLINTSRQLIVNERDLAEALVERKIAGAALDMLIEEPFNMESSDLIIKEMINMQNVIVTPHIAGVTRESKDIIGDYFLQNIQDFFSGKDRNLVF